MGESETSAAVEWIAAKEPNSWFWSHHVPARPQVAQPVLSRMCRDESLGLRRVVRGLYWLGFPEGHEFHGIGPNLEIGALIYAGPGAGLARWNALNRLGWTLQCDPKASVAVVTRRLQPIGPTVRFFTHSNRRREFLSWAEVTILEALGMIGYTEEPWDDCLKMLEDGVSASRLQWDLPIRPDALAWASETEGQDGEYMLHRIREISKALPVPR